MQRHGDLVALFCGQLAQVLVHRGKEFGVVAAGEESPRPNDLQTNHVHVILHESVSIEIEFVPAIARKQVGESVFEDFQKCRHGRIAVPLQLDQA